MIKSLHLTNFRQHADLALNFSEGVNVLRGANEAGKSTVFEAVNFAMFGVRACRNSDITRWGAQPNSHAVGLTFTVGSLTYELKRSTRGAEITWEGGRVTGQTEVSRFCEELLELKPGTGSKLMFVGQNSVRGILEEGGAKSAQMIESLAGFDQIETWIETLQAEFPIGRTELYEQSLQVATQRAAELEDELAALPDPQTEADKLKQGLADRRRELESQNADLSAQATDLEQQVAEAIGRERSAQDLQRRIDDAKAAAAPLQQEMEKHAPLNITERVAEAERSFEEMEHLAVIWEDFSKVSSYEPPKNRRQGVTRGDILKDYEALTQQVKACREQIAGVEGEISTLTRSLHTSVACPTCQREWDNAEQLKLSNQRTQEEIDSLRQKLIPLKETLPQNEAECRSLRLLLDVQVPDVPPNSRWQKVEDGYYPPLFTWNGDRPTKVDQSQLRAARNSLQELQLQHQSLQTQIARRREALTKLRELQDELVCLRQQMDDLPQGPSSVDLRLQLNDVNHQQDVIKQGLAAVAQGEANLELDIRALFDNWEKASKKVEDAKAEVERQQSVLAEMSLNNRLLKALRTLKPQIADKVWQTVCSTISHYFSLLRGTTSVVSKGAGGFTVDGKEIGSLSGSTLDILGIATRVALVKTFIPSCGFIFLDEPFAACDAQRQTQALGFITSAGFNQILIVTHEDTSETVAGHLVTL